jgi:hypothetical protein
VRYLLWAFLALALLAAFDHMMRVDAARLCASDATAYEGCP